MIASLFMVIAFIFLLVVIIVTGDLRMELFIGLEIFGQEQFGILGHKILWQARQTI